MTMARTELADRSLELSDCPVCSHRVHCAARDCPSCHTPWPLQPERELLGEQRCLLLRFVWFLGWALLLVTLLL